MNVNCVITGCGVDMYAKDNDTYCAVVLCTDVTQLPERLKDLKFREFSSSAVVVDVDQVSVWTVSPGPRTSGKVDWAVYANVYGDVIPLFSTENREVCEEVRDWLIELIADRSMSDELMTLNMRDMAIEAVECMVNSRCDEPVT